MDDESDSLSPDYIHLMSTYGNTISEFLNLPLANYETLNVYTVEQPDFLDPLKERRLFSPMELKLIAFHVIHNRYCYIPKVSAAFLGSSGHNATAELSAVHILRSQTGIEAFFSNHSEDFYRLHLKLVLASLAA
jgi:hypothetical protein